MKSFFVLVVFAMVALLSCSPVLDRRYLEKGERAVSFEALRENAGEYAGRLFILGGVIVHTRLTETGPEIEAMQVPVDSSGYFQDRGRSEGRFLAFAPKDGQVDPLVYETGRRVALAAEFVDVRTGMIDEMTYRYPVFRIRQIRLLPMEQVYGPPYYYDLWYDPFPYYYRHLRSFDSQKK